MIKVENVDVWGFEHAINNMSAKGYRRRKNGKYETFISDKCKTISLGTYENEIDARNAVLEYRKNRFFERVSRNEKDPYEGKEYKNNYIVFPSGNIYNLHGVKMIGGIDRCGYHEIIINGKNELVHRIIAELFLDNHRNCEQVNHINGIKTDNRVENLEWCTRSENLKHAYSTGLEKRVSGLNHHSSKLTEEDVRFIRSVYKKRDKKYGATALGRKFGVDRTVISDVANYKTYKEVI